MWTVVTDVTSLTYESLGSAQSALEFAKQVDPNAELREATFLEVNKYNDEKQGKFYYGSEPNGDTFEAWRNAAGEICLFATIDGKRYEDYWPASQFEVANVQQRLMDWGYELFTPNDLGD